MTSDFNAASWRRSSACGDGASCVEVARINTSIGIRDSRASLVTIGELAWRMFTIGVSDGFGVDQRAEDLTSGLAVSYQLRDY